MIFAIRCADQLAGRSFADQEPSLRDHKTPEKPAGWFDQLAMPPCKILGLPTCLPTMHGSPVLIPKVLLLLWQTNLNFPTDGGRIDFLEMFAGEAEATKYWSDKGYRCCKVDLGYGEAMDFEKSGCFLMCLHTVLSEVADAFNLMAPVCVLIILVILAQNGIFGLEQPLQSLAPRHKRLEWLMNRVAFVYVVYFHMMHFGKCCPKPSQMLSNLRTISMLNMGPLTRDQRDSVERVETCRKYRDRDGYLRYQGTRALKSTQSYTRAFGKRLLEAYEAGRSQPRMDLRTRPKLDLRKSDRELFEDLPMGDIWFESQCHLAFEYLFTSKSLRIPQTWESTMTTFRAELLAEVKRIEANPESQLCI
eukprot:s546_g6.t1